MAFDFSVDGILIPVYDGSDFQENNLTITGTDGITVSQTGGTFEISSDVTATGIDSTYLRLDGTNGPMTGFFDLAGDPTTNLQAATKQYVDSQVSSATVTVEDDDVEQHDSVTTFNFSTALTAVSGAAGQVDLSVNESELTTVVFLTGDQTIEGNKTFNGDIVINNLTTTGTTTFLSTEELLVEDNIITLNSTFSGSPTLDAGIEVNRGDDPYAVLYFDESADYWVAGISGSEERILLESDLTDLESDLTALSGALQTQIDGNDSDITTLSGLIDQNASDITTLSGYTEANFLRLDGSNDPMTGNLDLASGVDILSAASGTSDLGSAAAPFAELHVDQGFNYNAPTLDDHIANKAYVDSQVSSATIAVEESGVEVNDSVNTFNFLDGFTVTSGAGSVDIALDAIEGNFMDLENDQTASGIKTFADGIILGSLSEPTTATGTGTAGDIRWADDYIYVCTATDTWKRVAIASF